MFADYQEKQFIIKVIRDALALEPSPRVRLTSVFIGSNFPMLLKEGSVETLAQQAVNLCVADDYNNNPTWLYMLLDSFSVLDSRIGLIMKRIQENKSSRADPLKQVILNNEIPFVNRSGFRTHILRLAEQQANTKPILVVTGEGKTGKTYSSTFIEHFSNQRSSIVTSKIEFDPELAADMGAEQVAQKLVTLMGRKFENKPSPTTNNKLYIQRLAEWVLYEALQTDWQNWFILDNFKGISLRQDVRDFIVALSDQITTGLSAQRCRLFLIAFDRANLTVEPSKVEEDLVTRMKKDDVDVVINDIVGRAVGPVDKNHVDAFVLSNLPADESKLCELNMRLRIAITVISRLNKLLETRADTDYEKVFLQMIDDLPPGTAGLLEVQERLTLLAETSQDIYV